MTLTEAGVKLKHVRCIIKTNQVWRNYKHHGVYDVNKFVRHEIMWF